MSFENKIVSNKAQRNKICILLVAAEDDVKKWCTKNARIFIKELKQRSKFTLRNLEKISALISGWRNYAGWAVGHTFFKYLANSSKLICF